MLPWRVGPTLAVAVLVAAAAMPVRLHGKSSVLLDVAPAGGLVVVSGCGMDAVPFEPGTRMELHIPAVPCRLEPMVTAGALSVPGTPLEIRDFGGHSRLEVPAWTPGGVGITLASGRTVSLLHPDGPADRGGLREGDRIVAVGGRSLDGVSSDETPPYIIGPVGEPVTLTIERGDATFDVTIERAFIPEWTPERRRFPLR